MMNRCDKYKHTDSEWIENIFIEKRFAYYLAWLTYVLLIVSIVSSNPPVNVS
jgi:hypothetical protein